MSNETKIRQLERRADYYRYRLSEGHHNKGVITRWKRELLRAQAMILALQNGRRATEWQDYKAQVGGEWPPIRY